MKLIDNTISRIILSINPNCNTSTQLKTKLKKTQPHISKVKKQLLEHNLIKYTINTKLDDRYKILKLTKKGISLKKLILDIKRYEK